MGHLEKLVNTLGKNLHNEIPIRQLSKESKVPNTTAHRLISKNRELFKINQKGNIKLVSLNFSDSITKNHLILSERKETEDFVKRHPKIKVLRRDLPKGDYTVVLFGSRADETHRKKSDIDLCIISKDGKKSISFSQFELIFGIQINPMFFKREEFVAMIKDKGHNLADEIIKKHIILHGEEYFWNMVWQNGI